MNKGDILTGDAFTLEYDSRNGHSVWLYRRKNREDPVIVRIGDNFNLANDIYSSNKKSSFEVTEFLGFRSDGYYGNVPVIRGNLVE